MRDFLYRHALLFVISGSLLIFVGLPYWFASSFTGYDLRVNRLTYDGVSTLETSGWLAVTLDFLMAITLSLSPIILFAFLHIVKRLMKKT